MDTILKEKLSLSPSTHRATNEAKIVPTSRNYESDISVRHLYNRWCAHYNISRTAEEMANRLHIFKKNVLQVAEMNQIAGSSCQFHLSSICDEKDLFDLSCDEKRPSHPHSAQDMASEDAVWDLYYRWCLYHKILRSLEEMKQRFNNFKTIAEYAVRKMEKDPSCNFPLSDWCDKIQLHYLRGGDEMGLTPTKWDMESDEALMELYCRWCRHHKIDRTPMEMQLAFKSFKRSATHAFKMSQEDPTVQFGLSKWCDETEHHPVGKVIGIPTERDLESGNALLDLYFRLCRKNGVRRMPEEIRLRFNDFKKNAFEVFEKNKRAPKVPEHTFPCCLISLSGCLTDPYGPVCLRPTFKDLGSREATMDLYRRWCLNNDISRTRKEMEQRFNIFEEFAKNVFYDNIEEGGSSALTVWCDEKIDWNGLAFSSDEQ